MGDVELVEGSYDLSGGTEAWAQRMVDRIVPIAGLDLDMAAGFGWRLEQGRLGVTFQVGSEKARELFAQGYSPTSHAAGTNGSDVSNRLIDAVYRIPGPFISGRERLGDDYGAFIRGGLPDFFGEVVCLRADLDGERGFMVAIPSRAVVKTGPNQKRRYQRLAAHMTSGYRLLASLTSARVGASSLADSELSEAVLSPDGRTVHAEGCAKDTDAREALRDAARRIDWARTRAGRSEPERALELWQGLVSGRWSLIDHFDADGRRYLLAIRNDPHLSEPRTLTLRERQVASLAGLGYPNKLIAYALGISLSSVATLLRRACSKLGLGGRGALVQFFAQLSPPA
jgi:DNA-binding CsgD family transcriptional regulator